MLTKLHLYTYNTDNMAEAPTETIPLKMCKGVKSAEDETKKPNSFKVEVGQMVFYFYADANQEKEKWIGEISKLHINRQGNDQPENYQ